MNTTAQTKRRRKTWRLARWLLLILLAPPLLWLAWNWHDEAPNAAALELSQPLAHGVADADNAWLFLNGMGAAEGEDPIAYGRQRVDAYHADGLEATRAGDPLPLQRPKLPQDSTPEFCPFRIVNCLDWAQSNAATLQRLRQANALRLQRVAKLLTLPQWDNVYRMHIDTPYPGTGDLQLHYDLLALDAGTALAANDAAALDAVMQHMADTVKFFRRVQARPQDLISLMVSVNAITRQYQLLDQLLDRVDAQQIAKLQPAIAAILQSPAAPIDWSESFRREYEITADLTDDAVIGIVTDYRRCVDRGQEGCVLKRVIGLAFQPQATRNRMADNYLGLLQAMQQPAPQLKLALARAKDQAQQRNPGFDGVINSARAIAYNPIGKVMAAIALPEYDYAARVHDAEALRRSVALKVEALQRGLAPEQISDFLAAQPAEFTNPWSGQPLGWDPRRREIGFVPGSSHSQRARLGARFQPQPAAGVTACVKPLRLELRETRDGQARQAHALLSCGVGNIAYITDNQDESPDRERYVDVRAVVVDGRIDVEALLWDDDGKLRLYETRGADAGAETFWLDPVASKDDNTRIQVRLAAATDAAPLVSIAGPGMPADDLLQQIAAAAQVRIDHTELAGKQRIRMAFDIPAESAVTLIASSAEREVQTLGERHFALSRETAGGGKR